MSTPAPGPPALSPLVDCTVCDGRGLMTARAADRLTGPAAVTACPACDGAGGFVEITPRTDGAA